MRKRTTRRTQRNSIIKKNNPSKGCSFFVSGVIVQQHMRSRIRRKKIFLYGGIVLLCFVIFFLVQFILIVTELPRPEKITSFRPIQSTKIYDRTGAVLLYEIHDQQNRTIVSDSDIPVHAKQATIAVEDQGFYSHSAFDFRGFFRAVIANLRARDFVQGGSTITQQLVKQVFLTSEKTIKRKVKELVLAYWMEQQYTKDEILAFYLNQIPYGSNAYGIESASNLFFGVSAKELTIAQSAAIAAVIQSPTYYSPWGKNSAELLKRKDRVLKEMERLGFIDKNSLQSALQEKLIFQPQSHGKIKAPHFVIAVREYLVKKYGEEQVENGGLRVVTTLDWKKQELAERIVREGAIKNSQNYKGSNAALLAEDPKTGQVLALVGSADYFNSSIDGNFNVITQGLRQPGSTIKPFVYLSAFTKGYTPDTVVFDLPTEFNTTNDPRYNYSPQNFDPVYKGPVKLKEALAQSINVPAVKILYLTGLSYVLDTVKKLGISTLTDPSRYGLSLVLGGGEIVPNELIHAYSTLAQDGIQRSQSFILRVEDHRGNVLEKFENSGEQVLEPHYARLINAILSDSSLRAGLFSGSLPLTVFDGYSVALKTGTTNDYRDAWTIGYTPFLTVGVWAGNSSNSPMQRQGGSILAALPMWSSFMRETIGAYEPEPFLQTDTIIVEGNPVLNGEYITQKETGSPQIHEILFYIDKSDPRRFSPPRTNDPQFQNWETPVLSWARKNIPDFDLLYNK